MTSAPGSDPSNGATSASHEQSPSAFAQPVSRGKDRGERKHVDEGHVRQVDDDESGLVVARLRKQVAKLLEGDKIEVTMQGDHG